MTPYTSMAVFGINFTCMSRYRVGLTYNRISVSELGEAIKGSDKSLMVS